jgi:hypothetical protein
LRARGLESFAQLGLGVETPIDVFPQCFSDHFHFGGVVVRISKIEEIGRQSAANLCEGPRRLSRLAEVAFKNN